MASCTCSRSEECSEFLRSLRSHIDALLSGLQGQDVSGQALGRACLCDMGQLCGPVAWDVLHHWAAALRDQVCDRCGQDAVELASFLHDHINRKLGKPLHDGGLYHRVVGEIVRISEGKATLAAPKGSDRLARAVRDLAQDCEEERVKRGDGIAICQLQGVDLSFLPTDHEISALVCAGIKGPPHLGPLTHGDVDAVSFPGPCPGEERAIADLHTHPDIGPKPWLPSDHDLAVERGLPVCVGVPATGDLSCALVGPRA